MSGTEAEPSKRRLLKAAASATGILGAGIAATPLIKSLEPDAGVEAASVTTADISQVAPGQLITVSWVERPVFVVRRTPAMLQTLAQVTPRLLDPESTTAQQPPYCQNPFRSLKPEWLVVFGVCTHLCCSPLFRPAKDSVSPGWLGGFHCPCHGSFYDLAGRVFKGVPAPLNLAVPEYQFENNERQIRILGRYPGSILC